MPGLVDSHVHIIGDTLLKPLFPADLESGLADEKRQLLAYLANGVTTVRSMSTPLQTYREDSVLRIRDEVARREYPGPRIFAANKILDGKPKNFLAVAFDTPEEAVAYVQETYDKGYDLVKIYTGLPLDQFEAVIEKAQELGIPTAGHFPVRVDFEYGLKKGFKSIEHLSGFDFALSEEPLNEDPFKNYLTGYEYATKEKVDALAAMVSRYDIFVTPNLVINEFFIPRFERSFITEETASSRYQSELFKTFDVEKTGLFTESFLCIFAQTKGVRKYLVKKLQEFGVKLLAGTDAGLPNVVPGFSLLTELELLAEAGLTAYEVLRAATIHGAMFFNKHDDFGTIRKGASADLLLLGANPLLDIVNLRKQIGVMTRGQWFLHEELMSMLDREYPIVD